MAQASRTFRVFVSSTFSDLKAERDVLQERAFPALQDLCLQHGTRFQAIDLRWGVSEEAGVDQQTMNICLEELRRCQKVTPRPNFIVLLGERYGWRPLPPQIPADEFGAIAGALSPTDRAPLDEWYRRDDNAVPPEYVLQRRTGEYEDHDHWAVVEAELRAILLKAVSTLSLPEQALTKYERSATEQEILEGALAKATEPGHALCYLRTIEGRPADDAPAGFRDLVDGRPDTEAAGRLADLKRRLTEQLPPEQVRTYAAQWSGDGVSDAQLCALSLRVYLDLSRVILTEVAKLEQQSDLDREIAAHEAFCEDRARHFIGRQDIIRSVREYVQSGGPTPLVIWGPSGSGKSALMARCVELLRQQHPNAAVIDRFIGATPASTDIRSLLESLCREVSQAYGSQGELPPEYKDLVETFPKRLALATQDKPLILLLDALDQLDPTENAHALSWLPSDLPPNVRVIVSALEREGEAGECLVAARRRLPESALLKLEPLTPDEGAELLDTWLRAAKRTLQPEQREHILTSFAANGMALYLRIAFEEARRWHSYDGLPRGADGVPGLSADTEGLIRDLLARLELEANHGKMLVRRALGYLAAARHGLTEDEMLDVLSADEDAMADFVRRSPRSPKVDKLPVAVWSRLYFDLEPYLTERAADQTTLMAFYHRQVGEVVTEVYLAGDAATLLHRRLAEHFARQPHRLGDPYDGPPNVRKCAELPWQQMRGEWWEGLQATLTDLLFIEAKCLAGMTYDLVADCNAALAGGAPPRECALVEPFARFVRANAHIFAQRLEWVRQRAYNSAASGPVPQAAEHLLEGPAALSLPWLRHPNRPPAVSSACLQVLVGHTGEVPAVALTPDGKQAVSGSDDHTLRVWDLQTGDCLRTLQGHTRQVRAVALTPDGKQAVSGSVDCTLRVWDLQTGHCLRTLQGHYGSVYAVALTPDGKQAVAGDRDHTLRVWDLQTGHCLRTLKGHTDEVHAVALTPDGKQALSGSADGTLRLWDIQSGDCLRTLQGHTREVYAVALTPDGKQAVSGGGDHTLRVWNLQTGDCLRALQGHTDAVSAVTLTPDGKQAVSGSWDATLRVWDVQTGDCLRTLQGHTDMVFAVALTPDGKQAVSGSGDHTLRVWDLQTGDSLHTPQRHDGWVAAVALTPDGQQAVSGSDDRTLRLWDPQTGDCLRTLQGPTDRVRAVALTPDGKQAVSGGRHATLRVWDLQTGDCLRALQGHTYDEVAAVALTPDGQQAVSGSSDRTLRIWNLQTGLCLRTLQGHTRGVHAVALTPDGQQAVSGSRDHTLRVWNLQTGECLHTLEGHTQMVLAVALTPDGQQAVSGSRDHTLRVWDLQTGDCLRTLKGHTSFVTAAALTPDGKRAVSGSHDHTLRVWDLQAGDCLRTLQGHTDSVYAVALTPDGKQAVSASDDHTLRVWDLQTGDCRRTLQGHTDRVWAVALTPHGKQAISASRDRTLRVWDIQSGGQVASFSAGWSVGACAAGPGGLFAAGDGGGNVYLLRLENVACGPPILAAWRSPLDDTLAFGCLHCRVWSEVPKSPIGTELPCPHCGQPVKLNPFAIEADWRPVAEAWDGSRKAI